MLATVRGSGEVAKVVVGRAHTARRAAMRFPNRVHVAPKVPGVAMRLVSGRSWWRLSGPKHSAPGAPSHRRIANTPSDAQHGHVKSVHSALIGPIIGAQAQPALFGDPRGVNAGQVECGAIDA